MRAPPADATCCVSSREPPSTTITSERMARSFRTFWICGNRSLRFSCSLSAGTMMVRSGVAVIAETHVATGERAGKTLRRQTKRPIAQTIGLQTKLKVDFGLEPSAIFDRFNERTDHLGALHTLESLVVIAHVFVGETDRINLGQPEIETTLIRIATQVTKVLHQNE